MKSLLILPLLLAAAAQVKCGGLHRGVSSSFTPSSRQYSTGYRSGSDTTSLGGNGLDGNGLSGERSFGSSRFSSEAGLGRTGGFGFGNTGAEFRNAAGVGIDLGSSTGTLYSKQTETVNVPASRPFSLNVNRPLPVSGSVRRPVDVTRRFPDEESSPVRADVPRTYPVDVTRSYPDSVSQSWDVSVPFNVQSGIGSVSEAFGFNSGREIEWGGSSAGLERGFVGGNRNIGGIESGIRSGDIRGSSGLSSGSGYSDAYTSRWGPKWTYNSIGGYRY